MTTLFAARPGKYAGERAPLTPPSEWTVVLSTTLTVLSLVVVWFLLQAFVLSGLSESRKQDRLYAEFRTQLAAATAPTGGIIELGAPVAVLRFPDIGIEQVVAEGTTPGILLGGPGHRRDTVLPGQVGTSVIYGRSSTAGRPFATLLTDLPGKTMSVVTSQGATSYRIMGVRRAGDPIPTPPGAEESRIVFVTAQGSGFLDGLLNPDQVVYVDAVRHNKGAFQPPGGRLNAVSPAELPMAVDATVLPSLALFTGLLAVAVAGATWGSRTFGRVRTWLVFCPIVLALAWKVSDLAMELVPNLI